MCYLLLFTLFILLFSLLFSLTESPPIGNHLISYDRKPLVCQSSLSNYTIILKIILYPKKYLLILYHFLTFSTGSLIVEFILIFKSSFTGTQASINNALGSLFTNQTFASQNITFKAITVRVSGKNLMTSNFRDCYITQFFWHSGSSSSNLGYNRAVSRLASYPMHCLLV